MPLSIDLGDHVWPEPTTSSSSSCWPVGLRNCLMLPSTLSCQGTQQLALAHQHSNIPFPSVNTCSLPGVETGREQKHNTACELTYLQITGAHPPGFPCDAEFLATLDSSSFPKVEGPGFHLPGWHEVGGGWDGARIPW